MNNSLYKETTFSDNLSYRFSSVFKEEAPLEKITFSRIKKILKEKKDVRNSFLTNSSVETRDELRVPLLIGGVVGLIFSCIGGVFLTDPLVEKLNFETPTCYLVNMNSLKGGSVMFFHPFIIDAKGTSMPLMFTFFLLAPFLIKFLRCDVEGFKKRREAYDRLEKTKNSILKINKYTQNILRINQDGTTEEIQLNKLELSPGDIKTLFPFLPNKILSQLTFAHLENAKKYFEELFEKKLNDGRFSKPQQAIWYLFKELKEANLGNCLQILSRKLNQMILGSDPLVFEYLVKMKKSEIQEANEKLIFLLSHILKKEILDPTIDYDTVYDEKSLAALIQSIATGNDWHILHKENNK